MRADTLLSVGPGNAEIPVGTVLQEGTKIKLLAPAVVGAYDGELEEGRVDRTWTQGPRSLPLTFTRAK